MEGRKRIVVIVVLLVIIAFAAVFIIKNSSIGRLKQPEWVRDRKVEKIDSESLELVTRTIREWQKLGKRNGLYKNPNTGKYSMAMPMVCPACGATIPAPVGLGEANPDEAREIMEKHLCPKCGQPVIIF